MNKEQRILIAGCGDVGGAFGALLAAKGHQVWGLRRSVDRLPSSLQPFAADLSDPSTLTSLPENLDFVVYTAAASGRDPDAYRAAYVDGWKNVCDALQAQGQTPRRVLFTSSTGVYGQDDGSWVDEDSPTQPSSFSGKIMREAEELFLAGPWPATVLRLSGIYGPGRLRLIHMVREGRAQLSAEPAYTNRIHRDDCASALEHLVRQELAGKTLEDVYVGVDDEPAPRNDVYHWLADQLGCDPPPQTAKGPSGRGGNKRCRNARLRASGWEPAYPTFRDGYASVLADL